MRIPWFDGGEESRRDARLLTTMFLVALSMAIGIMLLCLIE